MKAKAKVAKKTRRNSLRTTRRSKTGRRKTVRRGGTKEEDDLAEKRKNLIQSAKMLGESRKKSDAAHTEEREVYYRERDRIARENPEMTEEELDDELEYGEIPEVDFVANKINTKDDIERAKRGNFKRAREELQDSYKKNAVRRRLETYHVLSKKMPSDLARETVKEHIPLTITKPKTTTDTNDIRMKMGLGTPGQEGWRRYWMKKP